MRAGVAGFVGERLEQAMKARGINQVSLAQLVEMSTATLSKWKTGQQSPEPKALDRLAQVLNLSTSFFLKPLPDKGQAPHFYRSNSATTKEARNKVDARLEWAEEISDFLSTYVDFPVVNLPDELTQNFKLLTDADIEAAALGCRKLWNLGLAPISDVVLSMESAGIIAVREEIGYLKLDGLSHWLGKSLDSSGSRPFTYLVADKANGPRARFDAAHELGHLILHRRVTKKDFDENFSLIEEQAHRFAGAFLLPAETFCAEVSSWPALDTFVALKKRWKTSIGAMIMRCKHLQVIDDDYATRLWKHYMSRGWRKGEPFDNLIPAEEPRVLSRAVKLLLEENIFNQKTIIASIGVSGKDIEDVCNLPIGYLTTERAPVINLAELRLKRQSEN